MGLHHFKEFSVACRRLEMRAADESFGSSAAVRECLLSLGNAHTQKSHSEQGFTAPNASVVTIQAHCKLKRKLHKAAQKFSHYTALGENS